MAEDVSPFSHYPPRNDMRSRTSRRLKEEAIRIALLATATLSIVTTLGILLSLTGETLLFFREVSIFEFLTETEWTPLFSIKKFGIWPLVTATALVAFIALAVAIPTGLLIAIYLSEFAKPRVRDVVKPVLEVLAGVPTVVYGYFALTLVTPILQDLIPGLRIFNAIERRPGDGHHDHTHGSLPERGCHRRGAPSIARGSVWLGCDPLRGSDTGRGAGGALRDRGLGSARAFPRRR